MSLHRCATVARDYRPAQWPAGEFWSCRRESRKVQTVSALSVRPQSAPITQTHGQFRRRHTCPGAAATDTRRARLVVLGDDHGD